MAADFDTWLVECGYDGYDGYALFAVEGMRAAWNAAVAQNSEFTNSAMVPCQLWPNPNGDCPAGRVECYKYSACQVAQHTLAEPLSEIPLDKHKANEYTCNT